MKLFYSLFITSSILLAIIQFRAKLYHVNPNNTISRPTDNTGLKIYDHIKLTGIIASQLKVNKSRPVSKYICVILLANAFDTEKNPGPRSPKWPCGTCNKAVTWKHKAICCDSCETWLHIKCQHIQTNVFRFMDASNVSWGCLQCGMPNFSTVLFNSTYTIETDNQFSSLSKCSNLCSPGMPTATSSPKDKPNKGKRTLKSKIKRLSEF